MHPSRSDLDFIAYSNVDQIVEKYPQLGFMKQHAIVEAVRSAAVALCRHNAANASVAPKASVPQAPRPSAATARREPTTQELIAEATRLTAQVQALSAAKSAPSAGDSLSAEESAALDARMGIQDSWPRGVVLEGNVQKFGVPVKPQASQPQRGRLSRAVIALAASDSDPRFTGRQS